MALTARGGPQERRGSARAKHEGGAEAIVRAARPRPFRSSFLDDIPAAVSATSYAAAEAQHAIAQARSCSASMCSIS